jgi:hypothetical protein
MMPTLTKEQWALIETELSRFYGTVYLRCDGYEVTAVVEAVATFKQAIVIYVNGWVKGEWIKGEAEEAKKFYRPMTRYLYPAKRREEAKKKAKSRGMAPAIREIWQRQATASVTTWAPYWNNAKTLCRHLRKTCADIEVVKIGYGGEV